MPKQFEASHILLRADQYKEKDARKLTKKLQKHPDQFGEIAGKKSGCPSGTHNAKLDGCMQSADSKKAKHQCQVQFGGYLGTFDSNMMVPSFSQKLDHMQPGDVDMTFMKEFNAFTIIKRHK